MSELYLETTFQFKRNMHYALQKEKKITDISIWRLSEMEKALVIIIVETPTDKDRL